MFRPVELDKPFDPQAMRARCPPHFTLKGMFFEGYAAKLRAAGGTWTKSYPAFRDAPQSEFIDLMCAVAAVVHPALPLRHAFSLLARESYPMLRDSMIGRVVFGVLGNDVVKVLRLGNKGYAIAMSGPTAQVLEVEERRALLRFERMSMPIEGWQTGVLEGAILACGREPERVAVDLEDEGSGRVELFWR